MTYLPGTSGIFNLTKTVFFLSIFGLFQTGFAQNQLPLINSNNTVTDSNNALLNSNNAFTSKTIASRFADECGAYVDIWVQNYGGMNTEVARSVLETSDGGFLVGGHTLSNDIDVTDNNGGVDFWLLKTDALGNKIWDRNFGGSSTDTGKCLQETSDGGFLFVGEAFSSDGDVGGTAGSFDCWVIKLDADGNIQWQQLYGGGSADNAEWAEPTPDGGYVIAGTTSSEDGDISQNQGIADNWVFKIDANGVIQWSQTFGGSQEDGLAFIQNTDDGGFITVGNTYSSNGDIPSNNGDLEATVFKLDALGNIQWARGLGGTGMDAAECVRQTLDGGYILTGKTASIDNDFIGNHGSSDAFAVKLDATGNTIWSKVYGGGATDEGTTILCNLDGTYALGGQSSSISEQVSSNNGLGDVWLLKLDADGNLIAENTFGGSMTEWVYDMRFTDAGGLIMCGFTESSDIDMPGNNGQGDFWIAFFGAPPVPPPYANLGEDITDACRGEEIMLDATDDNCINCTYAWEDDPTLTTPNRTVIANSTIVYTVSITNSIGCVEEDKVIIGVSTLGVAVIDVVNPSGCGQDNGLIETTPFGGTGSYDISWNIPGSTPRQENLSAGVYTIEVADGDCIISEEFELLAVDAPEVIVELGIDTAICDGQSLMLNAQNNGATYTWNTPNETNQTLEISTGGTYSVTVEDTETGCIGTDTIVVNQLETPELNLGNDITICDNAAALVSNVNNTNGLAFEWSTEQNTSTIIVTENDTYELTITNSQGCSAVDDIQVTLNNPPILDLGGNQVSCGASMLNANIENVTYNWSTSETSPTIEATVSDTYILTVTDGNGCTAMDSVTVSIVDDLEINLGADTTACATVTLDLGLPNLNYTWSTPNGGSTTLEVNNSGLYAVTVEDNDGCSDTDEIMITINPSLDLELGESIESCIPTTVSTTATNVEYAWANVSDSQIILSDTEEVLIENTGQYTLTISNDEGCITTDTIEVNIESNLDLELGPDTMTCGAIELNTNNPDANHEWSVTLENQPTTTVTNTGMVNVTITDDNGCSATDSIFVTIMDELELEVDKGDISCANASDGFITLALNNGTGNFTYEWEHDPMNTPGFNQLAGGFYNVTVTDEADCTVTETIEIIEPTPLDALLISDNISCTNPEVAIRSNVQGGSGDYTYTWSSGTSTDSEITVSTPSIYSVTVMDENNCETIASTVIEGSDPLNIEVASTTPNPCPSDQLGSVSINIIEGNGDYNYNWTYLNTGASINENTANLNNLNAGTYQVIVSDAEGCTQTVVAEVEGTMQFTPTMQSVDGCGTNGSATINIIGGTPPFNYLWSNKATTPSITALTSGEYTVEVTDANGCTLNDGVTIENNEAVLFDIEKTPIACNGDANGALSIFPTNGVAPFNYNWSNGMMSEEIDMLAEGVYTVSVTDANDCVSLSSITMNDPAPIQANIDIQNTNFGIDIFVSPEGGTAPYTILWNDGYNGFLYENALAGDYTITITDANGCMYNETFNTTTTSVLSTNFVANFSVFPNPSNGNFNVSATLQKSKNTQLIIRNALGQLMQQHTLDDRQVDTYITLDQATSGLYFIEIQNGAASAFKKVVVQ